MFWHKDCATILIRQNGSFVSVYLFGDADNLFLIHTNTRSEHRHRNCIVGYRKTFHCLTCNLTDTLACNQGSCSVLLRNLFCNPHHYSAHNQCEIILWTFINNFKLNLGERNNIKIDSAGIRCKEFGKLNYLFFCSVRCVRMTVEMNCIKANTSF